MRLTQVFFNNNVDTSKKIDKDVKIFKLVDVDSSKKKENAPIETIKKTNEEEINKIMIKHEEFKKSIREKWFFMDPSPSYNFFEVPFNENKKTWVDKLFFLLGLLFIIVFFCAFFDIIYF